MLSAVLPVTSKHLIAQWLIRWSAQEVRSAAKVRLGEQGQPVEQEPVVEHG